VTCEQEAWERIGQAALQTIVEHVPDPLTGPAGALCDVRAIARKGLEAK
jgi:hypothetical protein